MSAAAAGCWSRHHWVSGSSSITGQLFWQYHQDISWCGNGAGTGVYGLGCSAWGEEEAWGWDFQDHESYCALPVNAYNTFRYVSQGSFAACLAWCGVHASPYVNQQGADDGWYSGWGGT